MICYTCCQRLCRAAAYKHFDWPEPQVWQQPQQQQQQRLLQEGADESGAAAPTPPSLPRTLTLLTHHEDYPKVSERLQHAYKYICESDKARQWQLLWGSSRLKVNRLQTSK